MARAKKQIEETEPEDDFSIPEEAAPPPIMVKTREYREYIAPMPQPPAQPEPELVHVVEEDFEPQREQKPIKAVEPEIDPVEKRLREQLKLAGNVWTLTVYRLPSWAKTGNASLKSPGVQAITTLPFDLDTYEDTIRETCVKPGKPNHFLPVVRCNNRVFCHLDVVSFECDEEEKPSTPQFVPQPQQVKPADPFAEIDRAIELINKLEKRRDRLQPESPQQPATQGEVSLDTALLRVASEKPEVISRAVDKYFGGNAETSEPSWLAELIKGLMPYAGPLLAAATQRLMMGAQPQQPNGQPQMPPQPMPAQPQQQVEGQPPQEYLYLINRILEGIARGVKPELVAEEIAEAMEKDEGLAALIGGITDAPIDLIVSQLAMIAPQAKTMVETPRAKMWLSELQDCFTEDTEDDTTGNTSTMANG